jgi:hypothetical protein
MDAEDDTTYDYQQSANRKTAPKNHQRKYFPSNGAMSRIRNALTGVEYPFWRTGSQAAYDNLFHIVDTTGVCDNEGYVIAVKARKYTQYPNPQPNHLYYDNPEQFMRHQHIALNPTFVAQWRSRRAEMALAANQSTTSTTSTFILNDDDDE